MKNGRLVGTGYHDNEKWHQSWGILGAVQKPGSDDGKRGEAEDVFPRPLWTDERGELTRLIEKGDVRKFGGSDKKAFQLAFESTMLNSEKPESNILLEEEMPEVIPSPHIHA